MFLNLVALFVLSPLRTWWTLKEDPAESSSNLGLTLPPPPAKQAPHSYMLLCRQKQDSWLEPFLLPGHGLPHSECSSDPWVITLLAHAQGLAREVSGPLFRLNQRLQRSTPELGFRHPEKDPNCVSTSHTTSHSLLQLVEVDPQTCWLKSKCYRLLSIFLCLRKWPKFRATRGKSRS